MKKIFRGEVIKGKVMLDDQHTYNVLVWSLSGKKIEITLGTQKKTRSNQQNKYYHGVVLKLLSEYTGHSIPELHDSMRMLFLSDLTGKVPLMRSTTSLTTIEFEEYMSKIRQFASETLEFYLPEPNEVEF